MTKSKAIQVAISASASIVADIESNAWGIMLTTRQIMLATQQIMLALHPIMNRIPQLMLAIGRMMDALCRIQDVFGSLLLFFAFERAAFLGKSPTRSFCHLQIFASPSCFPSEKIAAAIAASVQSSSHSIVPSSATALLFAYRVRP